MKRRIFLGFGISEGLTKLILGWQKRKVFPNFIRLIAHENLHMTLVPPWYETDIEKVKSLLSEILLECKFRPFEVEFIRIRAFSHLLWLEGKKNVQLEVLRNKLLENFNIKEKKKSFIPHITLARFKKRGKTSDLSYLEDSLASVEKFSEVVVFESKLLRSGASYTVIAKFRL